MDTDLTLLTPNEPAFLFVPQDEQVRQGYEKGWSVKDIFNQNGDPAPGFVSTQDEFAISFTKEEAAAKVEKFLATKTEDEARALFQLCTQNQWQYNPAKNELVKGLWRDELVHCLYRPFDFRWTVFNRNVNVHRRERVMRHMLLGDNIGLIATRSTNDPWDCFVCNTIMGHKAMAAYDINSLFPLYLYPTAENLFDTPDAERRPNLSPAFLDALRATLSTTDAKPTETNENDPANAPTPEAIFHYLYALLHAPTYRTRYAEFLKRDFPRVPLPPSRAVFNQAAHIGARLVALHLLEDPALNPHGIGFPVAGDHVVQKMRVGDRYSAETGRVHLNATECFDNVPPAAWEFRVGGYQPAAKWLDDRAGRALTEDDIRHYRRMIAALRETGTLLPEADGVFAAVLAGS